MIKTPLSIFKVLLILSLLMCSNVYAKGVVQSIGNGYCALKHPIQAITGEDIYGNDHVCEEQHVNLQSKGGSNFNNIVWINKFEHSRTDRITPKLWLSERPTTKFFSYRLYMG